MGETSAALTYPLLPSIALAMHEPPSAGPRPPRLLDRVRDAVRARHYSRRTEKLRSLAVDGNVAASTQNQALSALLFLYREVLKQDVPWLDGVVRVKRPARLPVVLTREEVRAVIAQLLGTSRLMAILMHGSSLRLLECARLRVKDIDFARNQIVVRARKGDKDRDIPGLRSGPAPGLGDCQDRVAKEGSAPRLGSGPC